MVLDKKLVVFLGLIIVSSIGVCYKLYSADEGKGSVVKTNENIDIGINAQDSQVSIDILNSLLANEFVLLVQTLNYHWNLVGPQFNDYHKLFDDQYHKIFEMIDGIAERVRAIGGVALGSMSALINKADLKEDTGKVPTPIEMVQNLLDQHEDLIKKVRMGINQTAANSRDMGTSNFMTDIMEKHEKIAWMLRSLLGK